MSEKFQNQELSDFFGLRENAKGTDLYEWLLEDPRNLLYLELFICEREARKGGKRKTYDTHKFEANLYENLDRLTETLWRGEFKPLRGTAHIITRPVVREIFAAPFRDRVVHHWVYNQLVQYWDKRFIADSYSCRKGKGTLYGIKRLDYHIRAVSFNYARSVWIIKLDITGYFMHIVRKTLLKMVLDGMHEQFRRELSGQRFQILKQAVTEIIMDDPTRDAIINGDLDDWLKIPPSKSLFNQLPGIGLVIGNLTSQFFSNIYLNGLDRLITLELGYKHYGRYVDDFYIVVPDDKLEQLKRDILVIEKFLAGLGLSLNKKKTKVFRPWQGVPFLGAVVKDGVIIPGKRLVDNFSHAAYLVEIGEKTPDSMPSYLGLLSQFRSEKVVREVFEKFGWED